MTPVYGHKRAASNGSECGSWMDQFAQLKPEGGFRAAVEQAWGQSAPRTNVASPQRFLNGRVVLRPVYGRGRLAADAAHGGTWMDLFANLKPEGGARAVVEQAWKRSTFAHNDGSPALAA